MRLEGADGGIVVLLAANAWEGIKLADQHLAERLCESIPVLYVDPPLSAPRASSLLKRIAREGTFLTQLGPRLVRLSPVVQPYPGRAGFTKLTSRILQWYLRSALRQLGCRVRVLLHAWPLYDVGRAAGEDFLVFWAQDDFAGQGELIGMEAERLYRGEASLARRAHLVIAANPGVAERWQAAGARVRLIPFGCDAERLRDVDSLAPPPDVALAPPVAGFVGHINARIDLSLLEAVADAGISLLVIGPRDPAFEPARLEALFARPNVRWLGPKPFEALPAYLRAIDVGLVPYRDSAFNRGSFPLKTLEYLAAGRPVVGTDLPATRWLASDEIRHADGPAAIASAVEAAAKQERYEERRRARQAFAARHDWNLRARAFADAFAELEAERRAAAG